MTKALIVAALAGAVLGAAGMQWASAPPARDPFNYWTCDAKNHCVGRAGEVRDPPPPRVVDCSNPFAKYVDSVGPDGKACK